MSAPTDDFVFFNCLAVSPSDFRSGEHVLVKGQFAFTTKYVSVRLTLPHLTHPPTRQDAKMQPGTIGASAPQRQWAQLSRSGDNVPVEQISPSSISYLQSLDLEIGYMKKGLEIQEVYSVDELQRHFIKLYNGIVFSAGQSLPFEYHGENIMGRVKGLSTLELADEQMRGGPPSSSSKNRGILMDKTDISFIKAADSAIKIKGSAKKLVAPFSEGFTILFTTNQGSSECYPPGKLQVRGHGHRWSRH